jgi:hypothetical protein
LRFVLLRIATLIALVFAGTALADPPCGDDPDDYVKELDFHIDESLTGLSAESAAGRLADFVAERSDLYEAHHVAPSGQVSRTRPEDHS